MSVDPLATTARDNFAGGCLVLAGAIVVAVASALPYAGGWNDGSRLATVECLVDYGTLAIDRSVFVRVPPREERAAPAPYPADQPGLLRHGTGDKLWINGQFYSDKSPVPALLLAGFYQGWQRVMGLTARQRPDLFCYAMTVAASGLAYVVAVWCVYKLGRPLRLSLSLRLILTAGFALATVALPYARHVNNHILLLGVAAALMLGLAHLPFATSRSPHVSTSLLLGLGTLAGLGYAIDLGAGPILLVCTLALVVYRCRRFQPVTAFVLAALPWLVLHHAVNYAVGGTFKPANAVPEYFDWPGCTFNTQNLTGVWQHPNLGHFLKYAAALLAGKRGFLGHNLPLFLALVGFVILLRQHLVPQLCRPDVSTPADTAVAHRRNELPEVLFAGCWCGGTWLVYAMNSNNYSGLCCTVRWFVPLLAPGYYVLAVFLRQYPRYRGDFLILSGWGAVLAGLMWWQGPWMKKMVSFLDVPVFWPLQAAALLSWLGYRLWQRRREQATPLPAVESEPLANAA